MAEIIGGRDPPTYQSVNILQKLGMACQAIFSSTKNLKPTIENQNTPHNILVGEGASAIHTMSKSKMIPLRSFLHKKNIYDP
jgi:hypothetical protein